MISFVIYGEINEMTRDDIKLKYDTVGNILETALNNTNDIELVGGDENAELNMIKEHLGFMNEEFKREIKRLESSSEWDKLCIAFFGETNAGKSTIIESLRIIYDEESRRKEILEQKSNYIEAIKQNCNDYQQIIISLKNLNLALMNKKQNRVDIKKLVEISVGVIIGIIIGMLI